MPPAAHPAGPSARTGAGPVAGLWLAYVAFTIYGSLVPLDFRPADLDAAWRSFANLPFLSLGIESRADWVANGVLYIPVGYLTMAVLTGEHIGFGRWGASLVTAVFGMALALAVEYTQIHFPARTVSLNDVIAECIGTLVGIGIAALWHRSHILLVDLLKATSALTPIRMLQLYALAYCAASLFPYDFLVSVAEMESKFESGSVGWLVAGPPGDRHGTIGLMGRTLLETLTALPVGLLMASRFTGRIAAPVAALGLVGVLFGLAVEAAQFFIASGYTQGLSVATRAGAFAAAAVAWNARHDWPIERVARVARRLSPILAPIYVAGVAAVSGLARAGWQLEHAIGIWPTVHWMPFYYHYYTSESLALNSLLAVAGLYGPVGVLAWAWRVASFEAAIGAAALGLAVEVGKAFVPGLRPDPTNILVAAGAAWLVARVLGVAPRPNPPAGGNDGTAHLHPDPADMPGAMARAPEPSRTIGVSQIITLSLVALATAAWLLQFPVARGALAIGLVVAGVAVWRRPSRAFFIIPVALPLLDLAPWSGRFYLDEFDALALVVFSIAWMRSRPATSGWSIPPAAWAVAAALAVGTLKGLWPPVWPDANDWSTYSSPFNALRIVKGAVIAFAYAALWMRQTASGLRVAEPFVAGMCVGAVGTTVAVVVERVIFAGLTDLTSDYRVTGPFSQMHTGGAYVECYLTVTAPFLVMAIMQGGSAMRRLALAIALALSGYALAVTFSRGGYVAFSVAACLALASSLWAAGARVRFAVAPLVVAVLLAAFVLPLLSSPFAQKRLSERAGDLAVREAHWADALALRDSGGTATSIGMGLGSFPRLHRLLSAESARAATYRLLQDTDGNTFLRVGAGKAMYFDQLIDFDPTRPHTLSLRLRARSPASSVTVSVCRKWIYASRDCVSETFRADGDPERWQVLRTQWTPQPNLGGWPVKLSVHAPSGTHPVDIDDLRLGVAEGENLLANGGFDHGLDHWFFTNDDHLAWHVKNLPIAVYFDLGIMGLACFGWLLASALWRCGAAWLRGDAMSGGIFAAISGFLLVGLFDSLIDTPRFLFLLVFLALLGSRRLRPSR